jgi:uncharacterized protein (TIGR03437 family)
MITSFEGCTKITGRRHKLRRGTLKRATGAVLVALGLAALGFGQTGSFSGFTPGNLVVSRSVYVGDGSIVIAGQPLPPVCPSTASCGTAKASDSGAFPSTTSSNNVWNNDKVDGSFGITSPIFLDQIMPNGTLVNTLAIPSNLVTTSFSSKSELAVNLSTDGTALTFMAYIAPPNTVDVSNSNTPGVYDPTNPSGSSYFRSVVQVGANGAIQVTPVNAYSGNNGRAAILANGLYFMVGNSNNGSGTPTNVTSATGVEVATPGQAASTTPTQVGNFAITQVNDPATGKPYTTADKAGKDNNFRGVTVFNNTLYVTKGSGGNGINTAYQVGTAGTLPTLANAANTPLTVLPGLPTVLAKNLDATGNYPFGIWFANATTLYVEDEGDGTAADAAASPSAGIQKWVLSNGTWTRVYVLQNGLNLGQPYSVPNYPASLNPATDGIRNITGKINSDGSVTIYGITSTVSTNGDQGADPNKLVAVTDGLANMDPAVAAKEAFTILKSAAAGEVLRGVALTPTAPATPMSNVPLIVSSATPSVAGLAPGSIASAIGQNLSAANTEQIIGPFPTSWGGTSVSITDSAGKTSAAPLLFVAPWQVTFLVPAGVAVGNAQVKISSASGAQSDSNVQIAAVAPALFTLNGTGLAAGYAVRVSGGSQTIELDYALNSFGSFSPAPINMGSSTDQVFLVLYGSGLQAAGTAGVTATVNGVNAQVLYAGPQSGFPGLDQVNLLIPASLAGKGNVNVQLTANGIPANPVQVTIQ